MACKYKHNSLKQYRLTLLILTVLHLGFHPKSEELFDSYLEICEEDRFRRITPNDCSKEIFFEKLHEAPTCLCLSGIWKLYDSTCRFDIKFGDGACFQNRAKRFQSFTYIGSYNPDKIKKQLFVLLDIPTFYSLSLEQIMKALDQPIRIPSLTVVFVLNGDLYQRKTSYCIQFNPRKRGIISKYARIQGDIVTRSRCFGQVLRAVGHNYITSSVNQSECNLFCETPIERNSRLGKDNEHKASKRNIKPSDISSSETQRIAESSKDDKAIRQEILRNRKMLQYSIEGSFKEVTVEDFTSTKLQFSHGLLDQLKEITFRACGGFVSEEFLDRAVESLIVTTAELFPPEIFRENDAEMIGILLERCYMHSRSLRFAMDDCDGEVRNASGMFVPLEIPDRFGGSTRFHLVMDVTWNMVDLVTAFCIGAFKSSYRMYHELEQGMEKLYSAQLRSFWSNPDIPENFYERLFGPQWLMMARNLEKCVEGAYVQQPLLSRLRRPATVIPEKPKRSYKWAFENGTMKHKTGISQVRLIWSPPAGRDKNNNSMKINAEPSPTAQVKYDPPGSTTSTTPMTTISTKRGIDVHRSGLQWKRRLSASAATSGHVNTRSPSSVISDGSYLLSTVMEITCGRSKCAV